MKKDTSLREPPCDPREIALKSVFLGPQGENTPWVMKLVSETLERWASWRSSRFPSDGNAISPSDQNEPEFLARRERFRNTTHELLTRFEKEVPKFSPRYVGHMFSEISLPALMGHIVALLHNPNNISGEASRVGIQIEDEAIGYLLSMVGFPASGAGHFTSGGTLANFEALLRARARSDSFRPVEPGRPPVVLVPENKHYSWVKGCHLMGLPQGALWPIPLDEEGRLSIQALRELLQRAAQERRQVMLVVSVAGTTELGGVDPIGEVQDVLDEWETSSGSPIWHHVDAAYGGFFRTLDLGNTAALPARAASALLAIPRATSVTLDPHKLGYVPYASGAFLTQDKGDYFGLSTPDAPYIDFDRSVDRGPFTIEGSRSAAGASAMWMTAKTLGLNPEGYGLLLERTLRIRNRLAARLEASGLPVRVAPGCDTNVLCFACPKKGETLQDSNVRTLRVFEAFSPRGHGDFTVSKTALRWPAYGSLLDRWTSSWSAIRDANELVLVRMCLMNPFFDSMEMEVNFSDLFLSRLQELLAREGP